MQKRDHYEVGDLETLLKIGRERTMRAKEMQDYDVERMLYWIRQGDVALETRKDLELTSEDEYIFTLTEKGNKDYKEIVKQAYSRINRLKPLQMGYSFLKNITRFLQPSHQ